MDGVLVNFDAGLEAFNIKNDASFIHKPRSEWTEFQIQLDRQVIDRMNNEGFFFNLPPKEGFLDLWELANRLAPTYLLTAWPKTSVDKNRVKEEKFDWSIINLPDFKTSQFIYCGREEKANYATFGHILVDDLPANIAHWEQNNGTGILFTSSNQAINELQNLGL